MNFAKYAGIAAVALVSAGQAQAQTVVLGAVQTASIAGDGYHYGDNMLRSYEQPGLFVDGYMRFNLSGIADNATINSVTLTTYLDSSFGSPNNAPMAAIYLVSDDSWTNAAGYSSKPALGSVVSPTYSAFPTVSGAAMSWTIAASAVTSNLGDNFISLAMHGVKGSYSYVYFAGADNAATRPTLTVNYTAATAGVPEPATWAMMMIGFGAIGGALRRPKRATARIRYV